MDSTSTRKLQNPATLAQNKVVRHICVMSRISYHTEYLICKKINIFYNLYIAGWMDGWMDKQKFLRTFYTIHKSIRQHSTLQFIFDPLSPFSLSFLPFIIILVAPRRRRWLFLPHTLCRRYSRGFASRRSLLPPFRRLTRL